MANETGKDAFISYYSNFFDWARNENQIDKVLGKKNKPIIIVTPNKKEELIRLWQQEPLPLKELGYFPNAFYWPSNISLGEKLPGFDKGLFYLMNESSLFPVIALDPKANDLILDACAAPGGKTLATCSLESRCKIIASDKSPKRVSRMQALMNSMRLENVKVIRRSAEIIFKTHPNLFDKVLLDAPCSSEKHVWQNKNELAKWSESKIKRNAQNQYMLISSLALTLKPGGRLIYSTCALTPEENELMVARILKKKNDLLKLVPLGTPPFPLSTAKFKGLTLNKSVAQATWRVLPSEESELDPMFVAMFERV